MKLSTSVFDASKFEKYTGLKWSGILKGITKAQNPMQPIFEAFTNSLEAIQLRRHSGDIFDSYINVSFNFNMSLDGQRADIYSVEIEDNGVGLDADNYNRLVIFKDDTKGFNNRGSGRIQLIHFFEYACFTSVFKENGRCSERCVVLSKDPVFIQNNTLVYHDSVNELPANSVQFTRLVLETPLASKDKTFYSNLSLENVKKDLINHYILSLCSLREALPLITLSYVVSGKVQDTETIKIEDIPVPSSYDISISVPMYKISDDVKRIEQINGNDVNINITPFKINSEILDKSDIKLTSKGEILEAPKIKLTCLDPDADINGSRFLFLLSSPYLDDLEGDERGNIELIDKTEFKRRAKANGFIENQILVNDVQDLVNEKAAELYAEIAEKKKEFKATVEQLKRDYLLSDEALEEVSLGDNVEEVLKKAYNYDAKLMAHQNASYEDSISQLATLDPTSNLYTESLSSIVDELVESLPLQNRVTLSKYVARRRMVINLMDKILNRITLCQESSMRNEDEKLLHNLIFKQHSENPLDSDLWLINEEYMYFKGVSETQLSKVQIDGKRLFRDDFSEEEERYLTSLGENRLKMRCDILLFPNEGKCVIIEFKNPDVNVSEHLSQITKYAYFIRNFSTYDFKVLTFYGYLIGEGIEARDIRSADGDFLVAPNSDYMFRPKKTIPDESGKNEDGSLYMEVMKFSSLKQRAEIRNKAFTDRLFLERNNNEDND